MKKTVAVIFAVMFLLCSFASCKKNNAEVNNTQTSESSSYTVSSSEATQDNEILPTAESTETKTPLKTEPANDGKVVTYISENPNNKYICRVAEKYGSDKANLIAFIKKNSSTPGATVLEFSGKTDSNGNLITTADELVYVYEISDNGTNRRASKDGNNNDNYNKVAAKVAYSLGEKFLLPSIDEMRAERKYEDYFAD